MIVRLNEPKVVFAEPALDQSNQPLSGVTGATIRVFQVDAYAYVSILAATPMTNIADHWWAYEWEPTSLPAGHYFVEYAWTYGTAIYYGKDEFTVRDTPTSALEAAYLGDKLLDGTSNQLIITAPDHTTEIARFNTFSDADGNTPAVTNVVLTQRVDEGA